MINTLDKTEELYLLRDYVLLEKSITSMFGHFWYTYNAFFPYDWHPVLHTIHSIRDFCEVIFAQSFLAYVKGAIVSPSHRQVTTAEKQSSLWIRAFTRQYHRGKPVVRLGRSRHPAFMIKTDMPCQPAFSPFLQAWLHSNSQLPFEEVSSSETPQKKTSTNTDTFALDMSKTSHKWRTVHFAQSKQLGFILTLGNFSLCHSIWPLKLQQICS